jgi:SSS family solute:Na+ symporter
LLGLLTKRANAQGVNIGIVSSILFTAYAVMTSMKIGDSFIMDLGDWNFTHHKYMLGVYTHIIVLVVGYIASLFFKSEEPDANLTFHIWIKNRSE